MPRKAKPIDEELPKEHWCSGCPWGTSHGGFYYCPFVTGSCARLPETMEQPNEELADGLQMRTAYLRAQRRRERAGQEETQ